MKLSPLLALVLVGGCVDAANDGDPAGGGKADNGASFGDVTTAWELTVGYGGDAVVAGVAVQPDGKLLVRSHFPTWLDRVTTDGKLDHTFGGPYGESWTNERSGSLHVGAMDVWQISSDRFLAPVGDYGELNQLRGFLANGDADPAFGTAGSVSLYGTGTPKTLELALDRARHRVLAVVAHDPRSEAFGGWVLYAPATIDVVAYDAVTGAATTLGTYQLPAWSTDPSSKARVAGLVPQPDGSLVMVLDASFYPSLNEVAREFVQVVLREGTTPALTTLATTSYGTSVAGFVALPDGGYDLYVSGSGDGVSADDKDQKLVRISVDASLTAKLTTLGDALPTFNADCSGFVATPGYFVYGHTPDRNKPIEFTAYPKSGAPIHFKSDKPKRCLTSLSLGPDNHIYAGTWDVSDVAWKAQLTSFE